MPHERNSDVGNRTDRILGLEDIAAETRLVDFEFKDRFTYLCDLVPNTEKERLEISNSNPDILREGLLYMFVVEERVIKIGSATTSFKQRVNSYNCGRRAYRANGTCSTTNYFVLQSLLNINRKTSVYAFFPDTIEIPVFGEIETVSLPAKRFEKKLLTHLKEHGRLPIMCTQQ